MKRGDIDAFVFATLMEAKPFISKMRLELREEKPFKIYGRNDVPVLAAVSGIGKAPSAIAAGYLASIPGVRRIVNAGAAGALKKKYSLGDIFEPLKVIDYDSPSLVSGRERAILLSSESTVTGIVLATVDVPAVTPERREAISSSADIVDMEGYGAVLAAVLYGKEARLVKVVSDTIEDTDHGNIVANVKKVSESMAEYIADVIL